MKVLAKLILLIAMPFIFGSCDEQKNPPVSDNKVSPVRPDDLKAGGVYLLKNRDNSYYLTKIVIDDFAIHLRTYSDTFKIKPTDINTGDLKILVGHAPLDKNEFLIDKPELLKVEEVKESELEGYRFYIEAMSK